MRCDSLTCVKEKSYINNILNLLINAQFDYTPLLNKRPLKRPRRLFEKNALFVSKSSPTYRRMSHHMINYDKHEN